MSKALDMYDKQRFGSHYSDPEGLFKTIIGMLGFVNDNNKFNTGEKHESIKDVIEWTQHDAQLWNNILNVTGGTVNLLKCFFQVISTTFSRARVLVIAAHDKSWYIDSVDKTDNTTQGRNHCQPTHCTKVWVLSKEYVRNKMINLKSN